MPVMATSGTVGAAAPIPKFLLKLWSLVNDSATDGIVEWSEDGSCFIVKDQNQLIQLLPYYFKHNNMASFTRQLNIYGFRKVHDNSSSHAQLTNSNTLAFAHVDFVRDNPSGLSNIRRKCNGAATGLFVAEQPEDSMQKHMPGVAPNLQTKPTVSEPKSENSRQDHLNELIAIEMRNLSDRSDYNQKLIHLLQKENEKLNEEIETLKVQQQKHELIISRLFQIFADNFGGVKRKRKFEGSVERVGGFLEGSNGNFLQPRTNTMEASPTAMGPSEQSPSGVMIEELTDDLMSPSRIQSNKTDNSVVHLSSNVNLKGSSNVRGLLDSSKNHPLGKYANASNSLVPYNSNPHTMVNTLMSSQSKDVNNGGQPKPAKIFKLRYSKDGKASPRVVKVVHSSGATNTPAILQKPQQSSVASNQQMQQQGFFVPSSSTTLTSNVHPNTEMRTTTLVNPGTSAGVPVAAESTVESLLEGSLNDVNSSEAFPMVPTSVAPDSFPDDLAVSPFAPSFFGLDDDKQSFFDIGSPSELPDNLLSGNADLANHATIPPNVSMNDGDSLTRLQDNLRENQNSIYKLHGMLHLNNAPDGKVPSPGLPDFLFDSQDKGPSITESSSSDNKFSDLFTFSPVPGSLDQFLGVPPVVAKDAESSSGDQQVPVHQL